VVEYFFDNLSYLTGVLSHQTFITTAADTLQQQAIYSSVDASSPRYAFTAFTLAAM